MNNPAKIYIGMPVYNGEDFIGEAIQSVINQTFEDWELHIVDDCSTDLTKEIIDSFKDNRIKFHQNQKKLGLVRNFNQSIKFCQNEYIYFFHQDDVMKETNLAEKIEILEKHKNVGLVHSNIEVINEKGIITGPHWNKEASGDYIENGKTFLRKSLYSSIICMTSVLIRSKCIRELGRFDERFDYNCDYELWLRIASCYDVAYIHKPLIQYRWHSSNETHRFLNKFNGIKEKRLARILAIKKSRLNGLLNEVHKISREEIIDMASYHFSKGNLKESIKLSFFYLNNYYTESLRKDYLLLCASILNKIINKFIT